MRTMNCFLIHDTLDLGEDTKKNINLLIFFENERMKTLTKTFKIGKIIDYFECN